MARIFAPIPGFFRRWSGWPIRLRLVLLFSGLLLVALLILGLGLYWAVSTRLEGRLESELKRQAEDQLSSNIGGAITLPGPAINPDNGEAVLDDKGQPQFNNALQVDNSRLPETTVIFRLNGIAFNEPPTLLAKEPQLAELAASVATLPPDQGRFKQATVKTLVSTNLPNTSNIVPRQVLAYARPIYGPSDPINADSRFVPVGVYVDTRSYEETADVLATMQQILWITLPLAVLVSLGLGYLVAARALRPIKTITATAQQIGTTDLSRRIGLKSNDELGRLAHTFDAMIARLESSFQRQHRFTADASHELRSPLAVIEAEATLMLKRPRSPEDYTRALELIADEAARMKNLINDMLTLARADSGEVELRLRPLALDDIATEVIERLSSVAAQKQQHLDFDAADNVPVVGDYEALTSLVFNLVSNAVKYTPAGGHIRVRLWTTEQHTLLEVADDGPGIAAEHLPYLFDRFYRVDSARSRRIEGSGLGLTIAQWAASVHGGRIEVESRVGQGSTFRAILPRA